MKEKIVVTRINRYKDTHTFTEEENGDILWEGNFKFCRIGWPNDYTIAFNHFVSDGGKLSYNEFVEKVHGYDYEAMKMTELARKYSPYIKSDHSKLDMVDPSGGPYISVGNNLGFISKDFKDKIVERLESIGTGYRIVVKK